MFSIFKKYFGEDGVQYDTCDGGYGEAGQGDGNGADREGNGNAYDYDPAELKC